MPIHTDRPLHWRAMIAEDFESVSKLASEIHSNFFESDIVLRDKFEQFPKGCFILANGSSVSGYMLSHPWKRYAPPPLDKLLGELPSTPDTYYIHDLALAPSARGQGMAEEIVDKITLVARSLKLASVSLVAVGGSEVFWENQKFSTISTPELQKNLEPYGERAHYMERPTLIAIKADS